MHIKAKTIDDLLRKAYEKVLKKGKPVQGNKKGDNKELIGVLLELENPLSRISRSEKKGTIFSCLGEFIWYLSGSNKIDFIEHYIPGYSDFSDDGVTAQGAYGPRIFADLENHTSQLGKIITQLSESKVTRKAVVQIFDRKDTAKSSKDVPCTTTLQFFIRNNKLDLIVTMRSNDVYRGLPHDLFSFTMIQELVARELNVELGRYKHLANSLHLYLCDEESIKDYLSEGLHRSDAIMPRMPSIDLHKNLSLLREYESGIRNGSITDIGDRFESTPYWRDIVLLLLIYKYKNDQKKISKLKGEFTTRDYHLYAEKRERQINYNKTSPENTMKQLDLMANPFQRVMLEQCDGFSKLSDEFNAIFHEGMPVPYFGEIESSSVATIGINPSISEFIDKGSLELSGEDRRFETLGSLGINSWAEANNTIAEKLKNRCDDYFKGNPYTQWFDQLEFICSKINASYYSGSLVHLDIVPFTTTIKWGELRSSEKKSLLDISSNSLKKVLEASKVNLVILNGKSVIQYFEEIYNISLESKELQSINLKRSSGKDVIGYVVSSSINITLPDGSNRDIRILGFNHNIQSSFGVSSLVKRNISKWLQVEVEDK